GRFHLGDECFQILHIETDVIEDPALRRRFRNIGLLQRSWTLGTSETGALLRMLALAPKILPYQGWLAAIAFSGRKKCTCLLRAHRVSSWIERWVSDLLNSRSAAPSSKA